MRVHVQSGPSAYTETTFKAKNALCEYTEPYYGYNAFWMQLLGLLSLDSAVCPIVLFELD